MLLKPSQWSEQSYVMLHDERSVVCLLLHKKVDYKSIHVSKTIIVHTQTKQQKTDQLLNFNILKKNENHFYSQIFFNRNTYLHAFFHYTSFKASKAKVVQ
jgi:hypothetical protein